MIEVDGCPCEDWRCVKCNPPPVTDEDYGPPVYDPYFKCWTFPYAKEKERPKTPEKKVEVVVVPRPKPAQRTIEVQVPDWPEEPTKIQTDEKLVQTIAEVKTQTTHDNPSQTVPPIERYVQTRRQEFIVDRAAAIRVIIRFLRRVVRRRRLRDYYWLKGCLYSRKYIINPNSRNLEIMSMHMIYEFVNESCCHLVFTIFDYATATIVYRMQYELLEHVREFNVYGLLRLAKPSLQLLDFERSPFQLHIATLQSIIYKNRISYELLEDFKVPEPVSESSSEEYEPIRPATPPRIYRKLPGPSKQDASTCMIPFTEEKLIPKVLNVEIIQLWWRLYYYRHYRLLYKGERTIETGCCGPRRFEVKVWQVVKAFDTLDPHKVIDDYYLMKAREIEDQPDHVCKLKKLKEYCMNMDKFQWELLGDFYPLEPDRKAWLLRSQTIYDTVRLPAEWMKIKKHPDLRELTQGYFEIAVTLDV